MTTIINNYLCRFSKGLAKITVIGLGTAWINTALGFILPQPSRSYGGRSANSMETWISLVSTTCLAILTRSLQNMFPGEGNTQFFFSKKTMYMF